MKRTMTVLAILAALTFGGCRQSNNVPAPVASADVVQATKADKVSHACGALTKKGKPCTRRVSNGDGSDTAVEARCWQHRAAK